MMKKGKIFLCVILCLMMVISLCGCKIEYDSSENSSGVASVPGFIDDGHGNTSQTEESKEGKLVSNIAAPDGSEVNADASQAASSEVSEDDKEFTIEFDKNAIDTKYYKDYELSTTVTEMITACNDGIANWKAQIDTIYSAALKAAPETEAENIRNNHQAWLNELDKNLSLIKDQYQDSGSMGAFQAALDSMMYYREHIRDLCKIIFDNTGKIPEFTLVEDKE